MITNCMVCGSEIKDRPRRCSKCGTPTDAVMLRTKDFSIVLNDAYAFRDLKLSDVLNEIYRGMGEPFDLSKINKEAPK